jgi:hypothetical protein
MGKPVVRWLVLALLFVGPAPGLAGDDKDAVACTVRVISAHEKGEESIDPQLQSLKEMLSKPPFSSFHQFKLIKAHELTLRRDAPATFDIPGEHDGILTYQGVVSGSKRRLKMRLQIKDGSARLLSWQHTINDGGTFFQAGIRYQDGVLVLATTCRTAP